MDLKGLGHLYRNGMGVRGVDLQVQRGEVFGFLGPNGAGKTTLIRTIMGFLSPTFGSARVLGLDIVKHKEEMLSKIGYLPSEPALYDNFTGYENLDFALKVRGVEDRERVHLLADRLQVNLSLRVKALSRGNRQKVAILSALAHDPKLLILDEPTTGLDPLVQEIVRTLILDEKERGMTVFMSSHDLAEVEAVASRVGIIRDGELVAVDNVENLRRQRLKYVTVTLQGGCLEDFSFEGVRDLSADGRKIRFIYEGPVQRLLACLKDMIVADIEISDPPLEEVFRRFYGRGEN